MLAQRGHSVQVYEGRPDPRRAGYTGGRSINLALSERGWLALERAGMAAPVRELAIAMHGRMMHAPDGTLTFQPYGQAGQAIYSVSRGLLNQALTHAAEQAGASFYFGHRCRRVDLEAHTISLQTTNHQTKELAYLGPLFGADGAFSALRQALQRTDRFNYSQQYIDYGYKELTIPPGANGQHQLEKHALHIWPRHNYMLIALPNPDGSFTCTLFFPFEGETSFASLTTPAQVQAFFAAQFADAQALMPDLVEEFFANPTGSLHTVRCGPWVRGQAALIGDAAHAIVPFFGQGMNCGFEDCRILTELLDQQPSDWPAVLAAYQQQRPPHADAIGELALANFLEMRDLVADPRFLLRKKIEAQLHARFPQHWVPLYTMVTFSHLPYAEALRLGQRQEAIMRAVMQDPTLTADNWEQRLDLAALAQQMATAG
jgi:kynurenine 3-monooxygenase